MWSGHDEFRYFGEMFKYQPFVVRQLYKWEEKIEYSLSKIPIGLNTDDPEEIFYLNLNNSTRSLILGDSGTGKTTLLSALMDRIFLSGGKIFNVDLKGEYIYKYSPLQSFYHRFLLKGEIPQPLDIISYYPYFFTKFVSRKLVKTENYLQFSLEDINKFDLITLLGVRENRALQLIDKMWDEYRSGKIRNWEEAIEFINNDTFVHPYTRRNLVLVMRNLIKGGIIGDEIPPPNFIDNINDGLLVNLNLKGIMQYANFSNPASAYLAVILRKIYNAKVSGDLKRKEHHFIFIDEINKFCPNIGGGSSKHAILNLEDLSRSEKISIWMSSQDYKRIPDTLIRQANYIFLPYNIDLNDACELIKAALPHEYDIPQTFKAKIASVIGNLRKYKDGRRDWLVIDKSEKDYYFIAPLLPLSHLFSEGE